MLRDLTTAITKLALIEERQSQLSHTLDRVFRSVESLEVRLAHMEKQAPAANRINTWIDRLVWATLAGAVLFVLKKGGM